MADKWRPSWRGAVKGGLEGIEAMLLEDVKHKKKMKELDEEFRLRQDEEERKRQADMQETYIDAWTRIISSDAYTPETKRTITQEWSNQGLIPFSLPGMGMAPTPTGIPTAGVKGLYREGYTAPEIGEAPRMFEAPAVEPKERTYGATKEEWEEKKRFEQKIKGPTVAERKLGLNAQQVAAALERGLKITKEALTGRITSVPIGGTLKGIAQAATKEDAIRASIEMGWAPGTPEYEQHIAPAIDKWWETEGKFDALKKDPAVRKEVRIILKGNKIRPTEENIDKFIMNNYDKLME